MSWWRRAPRADSWGSCRHFLNAPAELERAFGNLASMSSGYASVRSQDGVCELRSLYLSAAGFCESHDRAGAAEPAGRQPGV